MPSKTHMHRQLAAPEKLDDRALMTASPLAPPVIDPALTGLIQETTHQFEDIAMAQAPIDALMEEIGREQDAKGEWTVQDDDLEQQSLNAQGNQSTIDGIINGYQGQMNDLLTQIDTVQEAINQRTENIAEAQHDRDVLQPSWDEANLQLSSQLFSLRDSLTRIGGELTRLGKTVTPQIETLIPELYPKEIGRAVDMAYALRTLTPAQTAQWQDRASPTADYNELLTGAILTWQKGSAQETIIHQAEHLDGILVQLASDQQSDQQTIDHLNQNVTTLRTSIEEQQNAWNSLAETINNLANARAEIPNQIAAIDTVISNLWNDIDDKTNLREAEENEAIAAEEALLTALETHVLECAPPDIAPASDVATLNGEGDALLARTKNIQTVLQDLQAAEPVIWSDGGKSRFAGLKQTIGDDAFALALDTQDWQERSGRAVGAVTSTFDEGIDPSVLVPLSIAPIYAEEPTELEELLRIPTVLDASMTQGFQLLTKQGDSMQLVNVDEATFVSTVSKELSMAESVAAWTLEDGYPVKKQPPRTEFDFTAFNGVLIPQAQDFGGGPRVSIPDIGLVEAYSNGLGLRFQNGALIVTRSGMRGIIDGDVFGYALREGDPQFMRVTITYTGTTPATLHFGIIDHPGTEAHIDLVQGTHTYELPKKASYVQVQSWDGLFAQIEHIAMFDPFLKDSGRNRPLELIAHATRVADVMSALQYLAQQVANLHTQGLLPEDLAHLPQEIADRIALLVREGNDIQAMQQTFADVPWGSLSPASMASLFPNEGMRDDLAISVMDFSGPAVTVAFRDPGFPTMVEIDHGAGIMGRRTAERSDAGGGMSFAQVSMNNATPSGMYQIRILDPQTANKVIGTMRIVWNSTTKTMSLGSDATMFLPQTYRRDDGVTPYDDMILQTLNDEGAVLTEGDAFTTRMKIAAGIHEAFTTVSSFDGYTNANIMAAERDTLVAALTSVYPDLHPMTPDEFNKAFYDCLPQWRWENEMQTRALYHWDHVSFDQSRGSEFNRINHNVGNYNEGIRDMIGQAFNVAAMFRQGRVTEANALIATMQARYDNRLSISEFHLTAPYFMVFVEACCNVLDAKPIDVMAACDGAAAETARLNYQAFFSPSFAGDGMVPDTNKDGSIKTDGNGHIAWKQSINYDNLTAHGVDAGQARNLVHIANKNLEYAIGSGAPANVIASMQNQVTLAMANYNNVLGGGTVLTFQQQNQQNILAAIAEGAPMTHLNTLAYLQENGLPIPTSAYDDFFASKEGLDYILSHMDLDDATDALVATGWLKGKSDGVLVAMEELEDQVRTVIGEVRFAPSFSADSAYEALIRNANIPLRNANNPLDTLHPIDSFYVDTRTVAGKVFYVLYQNMYSVDATARSTLFDQASAITGIDPREFAQAARYTSYHDMANRLKTAFERGGFKGIFKATDEVQSEEGIEVGTAFAAYNPAQQGIDAIRVGVSMPDEFPFDHISIYIVRPDNQANLPTSDAPPVITLTSRQAYADIPMQKFRNTGTDSFVVKAVTWPVGATNNSGIIFGLSNRFSIDFQTSGTVSMDAASILGAQWNSLTEQQRQTAQEALTFSDLSDLPKNKQLIDWLVANYLANGEMQFDGTKWVGEKIVDPNNALAGECKYWVQNDVVERALGTPDVSGYLIPNNDNTDAYEWDPISEKRLLQTYLDEEGNVQVYQESYQWQDSPNVMEIEKSKEQGAFDKSILDVKQVLRSGDMIQYHSSYDHTIIIGAIQNNGVWVFDSNFGTERNDHTPRYRFVDNVTLQSIVKFKVYRIAL